MNLADFYNAIDSGTDLKALSKMLKKLPIKDRRVAGIRFQAIKTTTKPAPPQKKKWQPKGNLLWSLARGPFGGGMVMYENGLIIRGSTYQPTILITGENFKVKEI